MGIEFCALGEAKLIILGVPYDGNPNETSGSRYAPDNIRKDLKGLFEEGEGEALKVHDAGNAGIIHGEPEVARTAITNKLSRLRDANPEAKLVILGGEHSITLPVVETLKPENYLCFDIHWDLCKPTGNPMEHESLNRSILDLGVNVEVRGARMGTDEEKALGATLGPVKDPVYISVDLDVLSAVPVSTDFSGNMDFNELWRSIDSRFVSACDITGYNPLLGKSLAPAQLLKRLILKLG